jgi:HPt (histidine-containing phosphotransfer) domain-containing protein
MLVTTVTPNAQNKKAAATKQSFPTPAGSVVHAAAPAYFVEKPTSPTSIRPMDAIDLDHIAALGGFGNPELVEILQDFINGLAAQSDELISALENVDREAFHESAHRLKGGAQMAGFPELGNLGVTWENLARDESPLPQADEVSKQLTAAIRSARTAFQEASSNY